uniref:Uncharacterized protein n=1 Tax=Nelumbo nucifera TaxID=4432 RepID=A0A822ZMY2_NELNU|nr:TPA_asm: hypothetical protein HUJ06_017301 [Nelumbo nucifera]
MSVVDVVVVMELRRLVCLKDKFRRDAVAPYKAAIEDLKKEVKAKEDITAAVRSIEVATNPNAIEDHTSAIVGAHYAKYALKSYVCREIFHGFDNETFYIDNNLSSLLNPDQF